VAAILLVDGDPSIRELMSVPLTAAGHKVIVAPSVSAGITLATVEKPQVVVSEIDFPGRDGFTLLEMIRAEPATAAAPFLFLVARDDPAARRRAMNAGADDWLGKPVTPAGLLAAIDARLQRVDALRAAAQPASARAAAPTVRSRVVGREFHAGIVLSISFCNLEALGAMPDGGHSRAVSTAMIGRIVEAIRVRGGQVLRRDTARLVAIFEQRPDTTAAQPIGLRKTTLEPAPALEAAIAAIVVAQDFRSAQDRRTGAARAAAFGAIAVLARGELELVTTLAGDDRDVRLEGQVMDAVTALASHAEAHRWSIAVSEPLARAAGAGFAFGAPAPVPGMPAAIGKAAVALEGVRPDAADPGAADEARAQGASVRMNSELLARALTAGASGAGDVAAAPVGPRVAAGGGQAFPEHRILGMLGRGGMSTVYLAIHVPTGAEQVLKVLTIDERDKEPLERFLQEYRLVAQIRHRNVARIFSQGFGKRTAYIAMEYLSGGDLRQRIDEGVVPPRLALSYLSQIALALAAIHEKGIVHRDLKPENLMLRGDGSLALADFGIAQNWKSRMSMTRHGEVYGTPYYMSSEHAQGLPTDPRTDLYSAGVIFYEMLTGQRPVDGPTAATVAYRQVHGTLPRLPAALEALQPLMDRILVKDLEQRFPSAVHLLRAARALDQELAEERAVG